MSVDYDVVVLGGSIEGRIAATSAVRYGARVALVEPPGLFEQRQQKRYLLRALQHLSRIKQGQQVAQWFAQNASPESEWDWPSVLQWSAVAAKTQDPELSLAVMNASGVDVVSEMPERLSHKLVVTTATRRLTARGIVAAFGTVPSPIFSEANPQTPFVTGIDPLLNAKSLPESLAIWGHSPEAVMWAQLLSLAGVKVQLIGEAFLPYEDWDMSRLLRSQLIAMGINILTPADIPPGSIDRLLNSSLHFGPGQPALTLPDFIYRSRDAATDYQQRTEAAYLYSNKRVQTQYPRIFVCGSLTDGFPMHEAMAVAQARLAIQNALFLPTARRRHTIVSEDYDRFGRVGQAPKFAIEGRAPRGDERFHFGSANDWQVWTASSSNSASLSQVSPGPLYCKLICYEKRLQSIHLVGEGAGELLAGPMAGMIGRPIKFVQSQLPGTGGLVDVVGEAVRRSQHSKWQPGQWRRDWAENWFNWRRSR